MSTRTKYLGGSTSIQYVDIRPKTELKEEDGANILRIYLPGFQKEQLRITYVNSSRTIRVGGERPTSTAQLISRFNQTFPVPENCDFSKIQGKFQDGVLVITMPKMVTKSAPKSTQEASVLPLKSEPEVPALSTPKAKPTATQKAPTLPPEVAPRAPLLPSKSEPKAPVPTPKPEQIVTQEAPSLPRKDGQKTTQESPLLPPKPEEKAIQEPPVLPQKAPLSTTSNIGKQSIEDKISTNITRTGTQKQESDKNVKAVVEQETSKETKPHQEGKEEFPPKFRYENATTSEVETEQQVNGGKLKEMGKNVFDVTKKALKLKELSNEEKQKLVKVGVVVVAIVALGAYLYYSRSSSSSSSDHVNNNE